MAWAVEAHVPLPGRSVFLPRLSVSPCLSLLWLLLCLSLKMSKLLIFKPHVMSIVLNIFFCSFPFAFTIMPSGSFKLIRTFSTSQPGVYPLPSGHIMHVYVAFWVVTVTRSYLWPGVHWKQGCPCSAVCAAALHTRTAPAQVPETPGSEPSMWHMVPPSVWDFLAWGASQLMGRVVPSGCHLGFRVLEGPPGPGREWQFPPPASPSWPFTWLLDPCDGPLATCVALDSTEVK